VGTDELRVCARGSAKAGRAPKEAVGLGPAAGDAQTFTDEEIPMRKLDAPYINIVLGLWTFASAFLWPHGMAAFVSTVIVGLVTAVTAAIATWVPPVRIVNTAMGIWLVCSLFAWPLESAVTSWNSFFVGAAITLVSLIGPDESEITSTRPLEPEDEFLPQS
jgi:hypothetical protein